VQLQFPFVASPETPPPAPSLPEDRVEFVRTRRARRYILRVRPDGTLRVTIPRGGSRAEAIAFLSRHLGWVATERQRVREQRANVPPEREAELRALAAATLIPRLHELAAQHGLTVSRVSIRNQRSRWGSCSRKGAISLNFRLVQMPAWVADYVLIHELMHLQQQNHGRRFWRLVERACPEFREAERWLRRHGRALF
jgi:predicted metal-dependent hydrolase